MAWLTAIGAVAGIAQGVIGGMASRDAAAAENKARKKQYQAELQREQAIYQQQVDQAELQYLWDNARVQQLRADEATNAMEQTRYGARMLDQAIKNMELNSSALADQFVTEEGLRGQEIVMNAQYDQEKRYMETQRELSNILASVNIRAAKLQGEVDEKLNASAELVASLALDEKKDHLKFQLEKIAAIQSGAKMKTYMYARQGGGRSARRLALEGLYELGAKYAEMHLDATDRDQKILLANKAMNDDLAAKSAEAAIRYEYLSDETGYVIDKFNKDTTMAQKQLKDLVVPTFGLAQKQYGREMQSLKNELDAIGGQATTTPRQKKIFDAVRPLVGAPTAGLGYSKVQGQSWGGTIGNALLAGMQGAMSGATVKDNGVLKWN